MQAVYFDDALTLKNDYPIPERQPGEALIRTVLAGVCNTDLEIVRGYMGFRGIPGHEFVGVVEDADNPDWIGRRVCGDINAACGTCDACRRGEQHHCPNRTVLGIFNRNGAFAEYFTLPESCLVEVPEGVSDEAAVFAEPLAAALEIPEQVAIAKNDPVIVLGDGKLGLLIAQALRLHSNDVTLLGRHPEKLAIAANRSVKTALSEDFDAPMSARIVVEATGSSEGLQKAMHLVRPRGVIVLKSTVANPYQIDLSPLVIHEITVVGSRCGPMDKALDVLASDGVDVRSLIREEFPLAEGVRAIEKAGERGMLKVLIKR